MARCRCRSKQHRIYSLPILSPRSPIPLSPDAAIAAPIAEPTSPSTGRAPPPPLRKSPARLAAPASDGRRLLLSRLLDAEMPLPAAQAGGGAGGGAAAVLHRAERPLRPVVVGLEAPVPGPRHGREEGRGGCETRRWEIQAHGGPPKDEFRLESKLCYARAGAPEVVGGEPGAEEGVRKEYRGYIYSS